MINAKAHNSQGYNDFPEFKSLMDAMEWSLLLLDMDESPYSFDESKKDFFSLKVFDGAHLMSSFADELDKDGSIYLNPGEVKLWDIGYNTSIKTMKINRDDGVNVQLQRFRTMEAKELRGKPRYGGRIIEHSHAFLTDEKQWFTNRGYHKLVPQRSDERIDIIYPVSMDSRYQIKHQSKESELQYIKEHNISWLMHLSIQFSAHFMWHAYIKEHTNSVGFQIPVTPEAFDDVFALRDPGLTKTGRKKAIIHWVRDHYRKVNCRTLDEEQRMVLVKKHLRGECKFNWKGLEVQIIPSNHDIKRCQSKKRFKSFD